MLSWFRFHSRVNSSLIKQRKRMNYASIVRTRSTTTNILPANRRRCSVLLVYQYIWWLVPPPLSEVVSFYTVAVFKPETQHLERNSSATLVHILSHENLAVRPFSKEVFWSLSFPGGSFGFIVNCPGGNKWDKRSWWQAGPHTSFFSLQKQTHPSTSVSWSNRCTFLSQSLDNPRFSSRSSSPRCWGYAVKRWQNSGVTGVTNKLNNKVNKHELIKKTNQHTNSFNISISINRTYLHHGGELVSIRRDLSQKLVTD